MMSLECDRTVDNYGAESGLCPTAKIVHFATTKQVERLEAWFTTLNKEGQWVQPHWLAVMHSRCLK